MKRAGLIIFCLLVLEGCALPLPIRIASWVIEGITYATTNKSIADHGLSVIAKKDCALIRTVTGDEICRDYSDDTLAVAYADTEAERAQTEAFASFETASGGSEGSGPSAVTEMAAVEDRAVYFVIGSFDMVAKAQEMADRYPTFSPSVHAADIESGRVYRVVVGPVEPARKVETHQRITAEGISDFWSITLDPAYWIIADLGDLMKQEEVASAEYGMSKTQ